MSGRRLCVSACRNFLHNPRMLLHTRSEELIKMNKSLMMLGVGLIMGAYLGYKNEEEIEEMAHLMQKNQKKMSRKAHHAYRRVCSCMEH